MSKLLKGRILKSEGGSEASLIIPIGNYCIMVFSDDSCGAGKGEIIRSELYVYHKDKKPCENINSKIFSSDFVIADSDTLLQAIDYCKNLKE